MIQQFLFAAEVVSATLIFISVLTLARKHKKASDERRKRQEEHEERIDNANRCLLRSQIVDIYYDHKDEKKIRQYERENLDLLYQGYKELGGNSFIDDIYKVITTWEVLT